MKSTKSKLSLGRFTILACCSFVGIILHAPIGLTAQVLPELLKDTNTDNAGSNPWLLLPGLNGEKYFNARDGVHGMEMWKTDGSSAGTQLVTDAVPGISGGGISGIEGRSVIVVDGVMYGQYDGGQDVRTEFGRSDGTPEGTYLIKDINPGTGTSNPFSLMYFDGYIYFEADDGIHGDELWRSDGTTEGTELFADLRPGPDGSFARPVGIVDGKMLVGGGDGTQPMLWVTDGTQAGTVILKENTRINQLTEFNGQFYFVGGNDRDSGDLYLTDGTSAGTTIVWGDGISSAGVTRKALIVYQGHLYFTVNGVINVEGLFRTDGTSFEQLFSALSQNLWV